jgi:hypothetical protein
MWVMTSASAVVFGAPLPCPSPRGLDAFGETRTLPAGGGDGGGWLVVPRLKPLVSTQVHQPGRAVNRLEQLKYTKSPKTFL